MFVSFQLSRIKKFCCCCIISLGNQVFGSLLLKIFCRWRLSLNFYISSEKIFGFGNRNFAENNSTRLAGNKSASGVERTFAWLNSSRRLNKNYEYTMLSAETMVKIFHLHTLLNCLWIHILKYWRNIFKGHFFIRKLHKNSTVAFSR